MRLFLATVLAVTSVSAFADAPFAVRSEATSQPRLLLSYQSESVPQNRSTNKVSNLGSSSELAAVDSSSSYFIGNIKRYDATWLYPVTQSSAMNVDLGLNLRYLDGQVLMASADGRVLKNYRSTIPMIYASALFDLPFKGLTARVDGGSQINVEWDNFFTSFDYKAALRYDWQNGIGLEGGWQHRQWQIEDLNNADGRIESRGLFLDLKYQF